MSRKIILEMSNGINCTAKLLDKEEPELCDRLWKEIENPLKMICQHPVSTGDYFAAFKRPPKHPVKVGSQSSPIGKKKWLLCNLDPGMIIYAGFAMMFAYGPHITEPLVASGSVVAKVEDKEISNLLNAGKCVWNAQYMTHRLVTLTISREEE